MVSRYNILFIHNQSQISGGERSLLNLWEHLNREQFFLRVILPEEGLLSRQAQRLDVKTDYFSFPRIHPLEMLDGMKAIGYLREYIKQHQIDLIHSYGPRNNVFSSLVGKIMRVPVLWHERNIPQEKEWDITRRFLFLPDAVICNSQAVANRFSEDEMIPSKIKIIPNGVNLKVFDKKERDHKLAGSLGFDGKQVVGIVTNLSPRRRVEYFIEVARLIHALKSETRFLVVGGEFTKESAGREQFLREMVQRSGLQQVVRFAGFQQDVPAYLSLCDVVCHVTKQDACSRAVLEAMASSKAIVAINDGGNPELVDHSVSGILVGADDKSSFVRSVIRLLEDPTLRDNMGRASRTKAEESFDVAVNARKTQDVYFQLLSKRKAGHGTEK